MHLQLPVRQYLQTTDKTSAPRTRIGSVQWVLARPLYRFQTFDLGQVPPKSRSQALQLELAQWTPFAQSSYYIAWQGSTALVWCWQADKTQSAITTQKLNPNRVNVLPETLLHAPAADGLCLQQCLEGFEGQLWQQNHLQRSRWWAQVPNADEWLSFQRDAAIAPGQQQNQVPQPQALVLQARPWISAGNSAGNLARQIERPAMALGLLALLTPAAWYAINIYTLQQSTAELLVQKNQLQMQAEPILQARSQALDHLARIKGLQALNRYPDPLSQMQKIAAALPRDDSSLKDWDYTAHQLKITLTASTDIAATPLIEALQKAGPFSDVKAMPGRDPKSVMFQMNVVLK
jgi:hypothetical protein